MAEDTQAENPLLDAALAESGVPTGRKKDDTPSYKMVGVSKIPTSHEHGKVWQGRRDAALKRRGDVQRSWDEALRYYYNDQLRHRDEGGDPDIAGNIAVARFVNRRSSETENVVFANTSALVPALYAKNPTVEVTATSQANEDLARLGEQLVNGLFAKRVAPGINLKPKARRAVVSAALTNRAWIEIAYVKKQDGAEQALVDLQNAAEKLAKAKTPSKIKEAEGELMAIERRFSFLEPSGPTAKFLRPHQVLIDPDAVEDDCSDAMWIMKGEFMPTEFLKAVFGTQGREDGEETKSIFEPTHVLSVGSTSGNSEHENGDFRIFEGSNDMHGYSDERAYRDAQRTFVWYVWDKITRRVFLYNHKDWSWPIWVWDDPYQLDCFFPFFPLSFYTNPEGGESKGEVSYYLDQQDAINEVNDEMRRIRLAVKRNIGYNKNVISPDEFEKAMKGEEQYGFGFDMPVEAKIGDAIFNVTPPSVGLRDFFDKGPLYQAIDRIASASDVERGAQFKTNTTNDAIAQYGAVQETRRDEKVDAIEDFIGKIGWAVLQLCFQNMSQEEVSAVVGKERAAGWRNLSSEDIADAFSARVVGGSTEKPTSQAKKREALQVGQILGQFARGAPAISIFMLKLFERSFEGVVMTAEDWDALIKSIESQQQRGNTEPGSGGGQADPAAIEQAVQLAASRGVPPEQARQMVMQRLQSAA